MGEFLVLKDVKYLVMPITHSYIPHFGSHSNGRVVWVNLHFACTLFTT